MREVEFQGCGVAEARNSSPLADLGGSRDSPEQVVALGHIQGSLHKEVVSKFYCLGEVHTQGFLDSCWRETGEECCQRGGPSCDVLMGEWGGCEGKVLEILQEVRLGGELHRFGHCYWLHGQRHQGAGSGVIFQMKLGVGWSRGEVL